ncbi:MAG: translation initiation factor IF-2 [Phycisphaerales bacterium]|nr:translation initiation factor IF-2 [Phycisphaerales bacterium]
MAKTVRLHNLAKELGIPSKSIIEKCRAEGIEVKNHMAAIPIGLAESIKEWFGAGDVATSVEIAEHPDLAKIPKRRPRRPTDTDSEGDADKHDSVSDAEFAEAAGADSHSDVEMPVEDAPVIAVPERLIVEKPAAEILPAAAAEAGALPAEPVESAGQGLVATPDPVQPEISELPGPVTPPAAPLRPAAAAPAPAEPPAPPVRPAGPQLVPKPAELRGPRVVRIEKPDVLPTPRPRTALGPAADRGGYAAGPPATGAPGAAGRRRPGVRTKEEEEAAKRGTRSPRRHGGIDDVVDKMREWRDQDLLERKERLASATGHGLRDRRAAERRRVHSISSPASPAGRARPDESLHLEAPLLVKDFCSAVGIPFPKLLPKLLEAGKTLTLNQSMDVETAELLVLSLNLNVTIVPARTAYERLQDEFEARERPNLLPRPPVVAMLGHVDHGKTSLLDAIRRTDVAAGEAGGITQHIGAYRIDHDNWHVTFLDTPGHEAFTSMRARGANLTDVVVLVVAADDGVMPQTVEALNHAKAAGVSIVVALNKIDLPGVDTNRIYANLSEHELVPTEWGGTTDVVKTSATTGLGVDDLLSHLSTLSELLDLKADATVPALAAVIEARMKEGQGVVAQVLVREGTLRPGQFVVCGPGAGRIRALIDDKGRRVNEAGPGTPVTVTGLDELPETGDRLFQVDSLDRAKTVAQEVRDQRRQASLAAVRRTRGLEELLAGATQGEVPTLNVILKADVQGSVDALKQKAAEFPADKVRLNLLHTGVGAISEADVRLAQASDAIVIGFTVVADDRARQLAEQVGVEIRTYRIIYEVLADIQKALEGLLEPIRREETRGKAEVRNIFNVSRVGTIAGCFVSDGSITRTSKVRLVRDGRIILERGSLQSLKRFKDDAREVRSGLECGMKIQDFDDVKPGDVIEAYEVVETAQSL